MAEPASDYLRFLPAVYRRPGPDGSGGDPAFLGAYLKIFEVILGRMRHPEAPPPSTPAQGPPAKATGTGPASPRKGLAALLDILPDLFHPQLEFLFDGDRAFMPPMEQGKPGATAEEKAAFTDAYLDLLNAYVGAAPAGHTDPDWPKAAEAWLEAFLRWQSGWIALGTDEAWDLDQRRGALARGLDLYRKRGTAAGMQGILASRIENDLTVGNVADAPPLVVGKSSRLTESYAPDDPLLGGIRPATFEVRIMVSTYDLGAPEVRQTLTAAKAIVDEEKPSHSSAIMCAVPYPFILGESSVVGRSTLLPIPQPTKGQMS